MDKTKLGAAAAISALLAVPAAGFAQAAPAVPPATSYADLLQPIPNASERLAIADAQEQEAPAQLIKTQVIVHDHHHHHHYRRHHRRVHHHHHHAQVFPAPRPYT